MTTTRNPFPHIGKVFKYDFISLAKSLVPFYVVLLVMGFINGAISLPMLKNSSGGETIFSTIMMGLYFCIMFGGFFVFYFTVAKRFQKSMLSDEAYLNLTLPVTIGEHQFARLLSSLIWGLLYGVVIILSALLFLLTGLSEISFGDIFDTLNEINTEFRELGLSPTSLYVWFFLNAIATSSVYILGLYFVKTVSHLAKNHRRLVEIVLIIVLIIIAEVVTTKVTQAGTNLYIGFKFSASIEDMEDLGAYSSILMKTFFIHLGFCVAFFFSNNYILSHHLNLE